MPTLSYVSSFSISKELVLSPNDLRTKYLFGIKLQSKDGSFITDATIKNKILIVQQEMEDKLSIKLIAQVFEEQLSLFPDDNFKTGYLRATKPIVCPISLNAYVGQIHVVNIPKESLSCKRPSDERFYSRNLYFLPSASSFFYGMSHNYLTLGPQVHIGNYWHVKYVTGWRNPPLTLVDIVAKVAAVNILSILSDSLLPNPGMNSQSITLDGLTQSVSTINSANSGLFGGRIKQYASEIKQAWSDVKDSYAGIPFTTL